MKSIIVLIANGLFLLYSILFFMDNTFLPKQWWHRVWNIILLLTALVVSYNILYIYLLKRHKEESGLMYKLISAGEKTFYAAHSFIQPVQKEFITHLIIAAVIIVVSLLLVGLPGAVLLSGLEKIRLVPKIEGDAAWPAAIMVSLIWPLSFPVSVLIKQYVQQQGYLNVSNTGSFLIIFIWTISTVMIIGWLAGGK